MVKLSTSELREQHEHLKSIITNLIQTGARQDLIQALSYVNKFLHDNMVRSMLEKDSDGNYINDENKKE